MANALFDALLSASNSGSRSELQLAFNNIVAFYGNDYARMDKDLASYRKSGNYGNIGEVLSKNPMVATSYENVEVWDGKEFVRPASFIGKTHGNTVNADCFFKVGKEVHILTSKLDEKKTLSVTETDMADEYSKVAHKIPADCKEVVCHIAIYSKISVRKLPELIQRAKNSKYTHVNIISMNPTLSKNKAYREAVERYSFLTFTPYENLWEQFVELLTKRFENDYQKFFRVLSSPLDKKTFIPRSQQIFIAEKVVDYLQNNRFAGISAICRFGKTVTASLALKYMFGEDFRGKIVTFLTYYPTNCAEQMKDFVEVFGAENVNISDANGSNFVYDPDKLNIVWMSVQFTFRETVKPTALYWLDKSNVVIYDEAHVAFGTPKQDDVLSYINDTCKVIVISATPYTTALANITFFTFTDYDRFMCDVRGDLSYYNNPSVIRIDMTSIRNKTTNEIYTWNSCKELFESDPDHNALECIMKCIIDKALSGIQLTYILNKMRKSVNKKSLYRDQALQRYLRNFLAYVGRREHIASFIKVLTKLRNDYAKHCDINFKFSVSEINDIEALEALRDFYEENSVKGANDMFEVTYNNEKEKPIINFFVCVGMNTTGCTIKNGDAVLHLYDGDGFNHVEQVTGRVKEQTRVKGYNGRENEFEHFTFSFDFCPNRNLAMYHDRMKKDERGNVLRNDAENQYYSNLYGCMNLEGVIILPDFDSFVDDMIRATISTSFERARNLSKFIVFHSYDITPYKGLLLCNPSKKKSKKNGKAIAEKNNTSSSVIPLTAKEISDNKKYIEQLFDELGTEILRLLCFVTDEAKERYRTGEIDIIELIEETCNNYGVKYVGYDA